MTHIYVTVAYLLLLSGVIIRQLKKVKSEEDFVVAGRGVPVYMLIGTLVCTWIGSGSLFGTAGLTFRTGISELWFSFGAWFGILIVYFIADKVRDLSACTLTDLLEKKYNRTIKLLASCCIILSYMVIAGYQFKGGGRFIHILTEGAISAETGTLISCIIIIAFTATAGMVSIVSIDIFNGALMIIAALIAVPLAISAGGGVSNVIETIQSHNPTHLSLLEGQSPLWMLAVMLPSFLLLISESSMYQKFSSAKDSKSAKKAVGGMLIGVILVETLMCVLAIIGYSLYVDDPRFYLENGVLNKAMAEEVILRIGYEAIPAWAGSLIFAAGVAIILSTGNTFLMVTSTNFTRDILRPKNEVKVQRVMIVILGVLAYILVARFETVLEIAFVAYTMIGASLAPALFAAFFWPRVTKVGAMASVVTGMSVVGGITLVNKLHMPVLDSDYIAIPAAGASVMALIVGSLVSSRVLKGCKAT